MKQKTLVGIVLAIAFIAGIWAAINVAPPESNIGAQAEQTSYFQQYPKRRDVPAFTLYRAGEGQLTTQDLKEQWTLVFLGYTFCPDVCPTTLASLNQIYPQIQEIDSDYPVKVMFLSVDPKRDTAKRLASYKSHFNEDFIAVSGGHDQLFPLVRSFGLMYSMPESTDQESYLVDHSASIILVGPDAKVVGRFKPQATPGKLAVADPKHILSDLPAIIAKK